MNPGWITAILAVLAAVLAWLGTWRRYRKDVRLVVWEVRHVREARYALRNVGKATAKGVEIDADRLPVVIGRLPQGTDVEPGDEVSWLMTGAWGRPMPDRVWVKHRGRSGYEPVQILRLP